MSLRKWLIGFGIVMTVLIVTVVVIVSKSQGKAAKGFQKLPDGSTLELKQVVFTSTNFGYTHQSRGVLVETIARFVPDFLLTRFPMRNWGSFGFGTSGTTNLFVITHHRRPVSTGIGRLRVVSESTNIYDACWGAHTLATPGDVVNGWQLRAFPRRSPTLTLELLGKERDGSWVKAGVFEVANPAYGTFPQWQSEAGPLIRTNENLVVTLAAFRTGVEMENGNPETVPRKTELHFTFTENGITTKDWRVQKLNISDATGNSWFPYLDLVNQGLNWARGGQVEFLGALWPGEQAWKLDVEIVRSGRISEQDLVTMDVLVPKPGLISRISDRWTHDGVTLALSGLASPGTDHAGNLKWTGQWWGQEKDNVYSLAVELLPDLQGQRLSLVRSIDQAGEHVELLEHRGADQNQQAFFLKPAANAETLRLTFALTRSHFVQFVARPEFN